MRWGYYYTQSPRQTCFRLAEARLCVDCEVIFEAEVCPVCGSESFVPVTKWIKPLQPAVHASRASGPETRAQGKQGAGPRDPVSLLFGYLHRRPRKAAWGKR